MGDALIRRAVPAAVLAVLATIAACAAPGDSPESLAAAYLDAVASGDWATAEALWCPEDRAAAGAARPQ